MSSMYITTFHVDGKFDYFMMNFTLNRIFFYDENYFSFPMESLLGNVGQKKYAYKISMPYLLVHFS